MPRCQPPSFKRNLQGTLSLRLFGLQPHYLLIIIPRSLIWNHLSVLQNVTKPFLSIDEDEDPMQVLYSI